MNSIVKIDTLYAGWAKFLLAHVRLADGTVITRQIEDHGRAIVVLPYDPARRCAVLVRQFRAPVHYVDGRQDMLEAIAGVVEDEDVAAAARREAEEEAGLSLTDLEHVGRVWSIPGISTERSDLFLAAYTPSHRTSAGGGLAAEHEEIEVVEMPLAELAAMADSGRLDDSKTFALVQTLRLRRPELFTRDAEAVCDAPERLPSSPVPARGGKKAPAKPAGKSVKEPGVKTSKASAKGKK